ncbi:MULTISPECIES: hypothetical protein [Burkholderia]|uniref:hypothetical protein n=1 Tax=Burkholderia TaxID=32008 RepID=UPI000841F7DF|nr:hypothetical protein AQ611_18010 [Burkholderia sp. Bp7605]
MAIAPVAPRGGMSGIASPKRRRPRRCDEPASNAEGVCGASRRAGASGGSAHTCIARGRQLVELRIDMAGDGFKKSVCILNALRIDQ